MNEKGEIILFYNTGHFTIASTHILNNPSRPAEIKNIPGGHTKLTLIPGLIKSDNGDVEKMRLSSLHN